MDLGRCPLCVVRTGGAVYALRDECTHQAVSLSEGEVTGGAIECWLHGSRFDLATGRVLSSPATQPVAVYSVRTDGEDVFVQIGTDGKDERDTAGLTPGGQAQPGRRRGTGWK